MGQTTKNTGHATGEAPTSSSASSAPFYALSPTNEAENARKYYDALDWALKYGKMVRNIALTGSYGSGKSSILKTYEYEKERGGEDLHFLYISLAQFNEKKETENKEKANDTERGMNVPRMKGEEEESKKDEAKEEIEKKVEEETTEDKEKKLRLIELSILQQLFYRESKKTLPYSRFKKIEKRSWWKRFLEIIGSVLFLLSLIYVIIPNRIATELNCCVLKDFTWVGYIVLITLVSICVYKSRILHSIKLHHFNFKYAGVEAGIEIDPTKMNESILNKYLDEILYFFEETDYNVVIIEDLDRFHSTEIFSKLRELNSLINGYEKIKRNIVFIYAICDEFFAGKERTKFFDFIIPVMPVVSASDSDEKLEEALLGSTPQKSDKPKVTIEDSEERLKEVIANLSLYIDDMRLLHNVTNEYNIYRNLITKEGLISSKLLAVILYKNLYPDDFSALLHNKGVLHDAIIKYAKVKVKGKEITIYDLFSIKEESKESEKTEKKWQQLLIFSLLKKEYIDENYSDYIHGGNLSKSDKQFLSYISNKSFPENPEKRFKHLLNNISSLMERIPKEDFDTEYILNYQLVDYLLAHADDYSEQRERIFTRMSNRKDISNDFVNGFIAREKSDIKKFYETIKDAWQDNILEDDVITIQNRDKLLEIAGTPAQRKERKEKYKEQQEEEKQKRKERYKEQQEEQKQQKKYKEQQEEDEGDIIFDDPELYNLEMVYVEGGTFWMGGTEEQGSDSRNNEKPVHQVTLDNFSIGKYPVTQAQWTKIMGNNPSGNAQGRNYPVECVSWNDAHEFCNRLNMVTGKKYRLPTEAEWEYVARGGKNKNKSKFSGSEILKKVGWYDENSGGSTHPVGEKNKCHDQLEIYDMSGNVWEWCSDWYGHYPADPQKNPKGPSRGSYSVLRGGSWNSLDANCRVSARGCVAPGGRRNGVGFRLVLP
ncbi:MAG: formylglycine-generating enzyme family protein [Prevotellaceae bacterium]|jgi:formylglycine-generating enzyme required for sulfatase activity|nr:formylglycine-generating enzyme family protein [Prevotellaceae bacterium]